MATHGGAEIVFVDAGVRDAAQLLSGTREGVRAVLLAADAPPLAQIAEVLEAGGPVATLHLVCHGAPGRLDFAGGALDETGLARWAAAAERVRDLLAPGARVALWACEVAAGTGQRFVAAMASALGAPVAAASGRVGASDEGPTWRLDCGGGALSPFRPAVAAAYSGSLAVVTGTPGDDTLTGSTSNDVVFGLGGADRLSGGDGDDTMFAGSGDDTVSGGGGSDFLWGAEGADSLIGGAGGDYFYGGGADLSGDTLADFTLGEDSIVIAGVTRRDPTGITLDGDTWGIDTDGDGNADIVLTIPGVSGTATLSLTANPAIGGSLQIAVGSGTAGDDTLAGIGGDNLIAGGNGNDVIAGLDGSDTIDGGFGYDIVYGGLGGDRLAGSQGDDSVYGGDGADLMYGGLGNDLLLGGDGDDTMAQDEGGSDVLSGGNGNDWLLHALGDSTLAGGAGNDFLQDLAGNNQLSGGTGTDRLIAGAGNDLLSGGDGNDTMIGGGGNDTMIGGTGADLLTVNGGDRIDAGTGLAELNDDTVSGFTATDSVRGADATLTLAGQSAGASSASVTLASGADTISMTFAGDYRAGHFGLADDGKSLVYDGVAPTLTTSVPGDEASGVATGANLVLTFSESVRAGTGSIVVKRIADDAVVHSIAVGDAAQVTFAGTQVTVNPATDLPAGTGYYVQIDAGAIVDGVGNSYAGIADKTTLNFATAAPPSDGGGGGDPSPPAGIIVVTPSTPTVPNGGTTPSGLPAVTETVSNTSSSQTGTAALVQNTGNANLVTATLPPQVSLVNEGSRTALTPTQAGPDLIGSIAAKAPTGNQPLQTTIAQDWIDARPPGTLLDIRTLTLSAAAAPGQPIVIAGTASGGSGSFQEAFVIDVTGLPPGTVIQLGNIEFASIKGSVQVTGGDGSNFVIGDDDAQIIVLGADDDTLMGGGGNDRVGSAAGNDVLYGNQGDDTVAGGADADTLYGGQNADQVYGNLGADVLYGNLSGDTLYGGQGDDTVHGGQGEDVLYGNLGDDRLRGGVAADTLFGGQGNDRAEGEAGSDSLAGGEGDDTLLGGDGDDTLRGGDGGDLLSGGGGSDVFVIGTGEGADSILGFSTADGDRIVYDGTEVLSTRVDDAGNTVLTLKGGGSLTLVGFVAPGDEPDPDEGAGSRSQMVPPTDDVMAWLGGGDD